MGTNPPGLPWLTLVLIGLALIVFVAFGPAHEAWVFDRAALRDGELWRLLTGHWVHGDVEHLLWNLGAFGVLGASLERHAGSGTLLGALLLGSLLVDFVLWFWLPGLSYYCGLSGALNALLLPALYGLKGRLPSPLLLVAGGGSLVKILLELYLGQALLTETVWASVPLAHLAGWGAGVLLLLTRVCESPLLCVLKSRISQLLGICFRLCRGLCSFGIRQ